MSTEQAIIAYIPEPAVDAASVWVRLEQEGIPLSLRNATLEDMVQMFNRAVSGLSARSYQLDKCRAASIKGNGTIVVELDVFVWPSSLDMPYTLTISYGTVGAAEPLEMEREVDLAVEGGRSVTLPWLLTNAIAWWQIPCVNEFSEPVDSPAITVTDTTVRLAAECYGVLRVRGLAQGYRHTITLEISKTTNTIPTDPTVASLQMSAGYNGSPLPVAQEALPTVIDPLGYAITNVDISVTAAYTDAAGEQQADIITLKIPDCVLDLLEYCPEGTLAAQDKSSGNWAWDSDPYTPVVYYDTCTGNEIEVHFVEDRK